MNRTTTEIAGSAFAGRRNKVGKLGVKHRQMDQAELEMLLGRAWDAALEEAARIIRSHGDDDERPIANVVLAIAEEVQP